MTLQESLDREGISGRIREEVLRPFFRLVFADEDLRTSYQFAMLSMQSLLAGHARPARAGHAGAAQPALASASSSPSSTEWTCWASCAALGEGVRILTDGGEIQARASWSRPTR